MRPPQESSGLFDHLKMKIRWTRGVQPTKGYNGDGAGLCDPHHTFYRLDTRCPAYFHFQVVKKTTWFWCRSLRPPPFLPFGTMLRNNIKKISTLFGTISKKNRHYSETFRHCSESIFLLAFQVIKKITWFHVLILRTWSAKLCGMGRGDPPQNQCVKMDHWFLSEQYQKKSLVLFRI